MLDLHFRNISIATAGRKHWGGGRNWSMLEEDRWIKEYYDGPGKRFDG